MVLTPMPDGLIIFDCDSTLSAIEGVDELARLRGEVIFREVQQLTLDAMEGRIALEDVFRRRMDVIRPSGADLDRLGQLYIETLAPGAEKVIKLLRGKGWQMAIVSGGLYPPVRRLADHLEIVPVRAVPVELTPEGDYLDFDATYPTARSGGKCECVRELKSALRAGFTVMVGDGVSDLETGEDVDGFIGFGGFEIREKVRQEADAFIDSFDQLPEVIEKMTGTCGR